jgi:hydrophobe/amphiphile efflux-3 (HAE3) family protein
MTAATRFERLAGAAARRPALTIGIVLALALGGGLLALHLKPSAGTDTFVGKSSAGYRATADAQRHFGDDAVVVLIREPLRDLVQTGDLATVTKLEACFAGQYVVANQALRAFTPVKSGTHGPYGGWRSPCGRLARAGPVHAVYGPGTFLNRAVAAVNTQIREMLAGVVTAVRGAQSDAYQLALGRGMSGKRAQSEAHAAGVLEYQRQMQALEQLARSWGITSLPSIDSPQFIPAIVFDQARGVNQPKPRFAYLFPTADSALIQVRLKSSLSDARQAQAITWIRQAIAMPMFRSAHGGKYTVTGVPVVLGALANTISGAIAGLLSAALLVMAVALLLVFRRRPRLLPLAIALAAAGITFGLLAVLGFTLTLASAAVLPILIGLAVDYGIQFQARVQEVQSASEAEGAVVHDGPARVDEAAVRTALVLTDRAVGQAAGRVAPTIATAALATATGFLALLLSPVPMVQGFGLLLVVGVAAALACALTAGSAALAISERRRVVRAGRLVSVGGFAPAGGGLPEPIAAWVRGAAEILAGAAGAVASAMRGAAAILRDGTRRLSGPLARRAPQAVATAPSPDAAPGRSAVLVTAITRRPGRVLALAAVLALAGWIADTQTGVQTDVTKLVPSDMPALRDLRTLEKVTGVSGDIDVTIRAANVVTPKTVAWMIDYEKRLLSHYGYVEAKGCASATLCPALSLPDLFSATGGATGQTHLTQAEIDQLLAAVPAYFKQAVVTPDRREATLAFGIRLMPLSRQERVVSYMRSQLRPPPGVSAALAGLPVLAAEANGAVSSSSHRLLTLLACLAAVALVLAIVFRQASRAIVPLIPIALATGWSALILFVIGIPLNPMSATLGTLVIAISTEFSVLLSERFRQERLAGYDLHGALRRTYRSTGAAVLASGITAIAGFGVLVLSDITMLRDFGFVTVVDLTVSLAGVLVVLPAVLAVSERGGAHAWTTAAPRGIAAGVARLRRRPRVA